MPDKSNSNNAQASSAPTRSAAAQKEQELKFESIMTRNLSENKPLVFLHEGDEGQKHQYSAEEMISLTKRDFHTRIFISSAVHRSNCVWIRNHHSDIVQTTSKFTYVRDYFKAAFATKNHTAAKTTLTAELTKWFDLDDHEYYTYATTLASGLSSDAANTSFEIQEAMVKSPDDVKVARRTLIILLDILFSKCRVKKFLHKENNANIYRLVHCATKHQKNKFPLIYVTFSFLLQLTLTIFVVLEIPNRTLKNLFSEMIFREAGADLDVEYSDPRSLFRSVSMYVLAILTGVYSIMVTSKEYTILRDVSKFYGKFGLLCCIDIVVNVILPTILIVSGCWVIIHEIDFIDAVLNTAAFLFIPEIDDQMPDLLGYDTEAMVENYLIAESKEQYNEITTLDKKGIHEKFENLKCNGDVGVPFNDYYITNDPEHGSSPKNGTLYQPHIVDKNEACGHEIDPSNYVTEDCLLKSVEWRYTTFDPTTTKPRVGYLKLVKLCGEVVEIKYKGVEAMDVGEKYTLKGVFVITNFAMSSGILKLRLCGSDCGQNFLRAFEYYSLWEITGDAKRLLHKFRSSKEIDQK